MLNASLFHIYSGILALDTFEIELGNLQSRMSPGYQDGSTGKGVCPQA